MRSLRKQIATLVSFALVLQLFPAPYAWALGEDAQVVQDASSEQTDLAIPDTDEAMEALPPDNMSAEESDGTDDQQVVDTAEDAADDQPSSDDPDADGANTPQEQTPASDGPQLGDAAAPMTADQDPLTASHDYKQPATRSKDQIREFFRTHPFDIEQEAEYTSEPHAAAPYALGDISDSNRQQTVNAINAVRFVAGLDANVTCDARYNEYAQAAALITAANGYMSHSPARPQGMDEALYEKAYEGASQSNLAIAGELLNRSPIETVLGYMNDEGPNNNRVDGHRRNLLGSRLAKIGVGHASGTHGDGDDSMLVNANAIYTTDNSNESYVTDVAWPARLMPTCLFEDGELDWTFSTDLSSLGSASSIAAEVVRVNDGQTWSLSQDADTLAVNTQSFGYDRGAVVWILKGCESYKNGDVFNVRIWGDAGEKSYKVEFFDLFEPDDLRVKLSDQGWYTNGQTIYLANENASLEVRPAGDFTQDALLGFAPFQALASKQAMDVSYRSSDEKVVSVKKGLGYYSVEDDDGDFFLGSQCAEITTVGSGKAKVVVTASGVDRLEIPIEVLPETNRGLTVYWNWEKLTYNGAEQHPDFTVNWFWEELQEGTGYTVEYKNCVNAGAATAIFRGKGEYEGSDAVVTYIIQPAPIEKATIAAIPDQPYMGGAIAVNPTVKVGKKTLKAGVDYTLSYKDNTKVGTGTVVVTGKGNYKGAKTVTFKIVKADITKAAIGNIADRSYTGGAIKPAVEVKMGNATLKAGIDYTVSYKGNVKVGTATVTITGTGSCTGTVVRTFKIVPANLSGATIAAVADQVYTGSKIEPAVEVKMGSAVLKKGTDYTVAYKDNVKIGTATVTVKGRGNYTGSKSVKFKIVEKIATQQMYRLYNPNSGEHFYTAKAKERDALKGVGWVYEGVGWTAPVESNTPVYRLYNRIAGDHHYTMKAGERDALLKINGWVDEGIGWYSDDAKGTPLYRQYNPNAVTGSHNYTTNAGERDFLVANGWIDEGIGWYGVKQ